MNINAPNSDKEGPGAPKLPLYVSEIFHLLVTRKMLVFDATMAVKLAAIVALRSTEQHHGTPEK